MPELPDVAIYIERLSALFKGQVIEQARLKSPFLVRSFEPPLSAVNGQRVTGFQRIGKRIVFELSDELYLVFHLMIAGRFHLKERGAKLTAKQFLLGLDFAEHTLVLTEAGTKRRASLHVVRGAANLAEFSRGGLEVLGSSLADFQAALFVENRTLKRALTDPRLFSGIGNAYSDEILHAARLSPVKLTRSLSEAEVSRLHAATERVLTLWIALLRSEAGSGFPEKVTAFRPQMAVHGRYQQPCPVCGTPVQRISYAANELNYCPKCQTGGKLLADRGLSRLLKTDWPKSLEELEDYKAARSAPAQPGASSAVVSQSRTKQPLGKQPAASKSLTTQSLAIESKTKRARVSKPPANESGASKPSGNEPTARGRASKAR